MQRFAVAFETLALACVPHHVSVQFQRIAGAMSRGQEERRAVQGGVLKRMKELEAKCGMMKSSKVRRLRCHCVADVFK